MRKYLTYDELLAKRLQKKYDLSDGTLRVWKHRNGIPMRYAERSYQGRMRASRAQLKRVEALLATPWVNRSGFEGIPGYRLNDFMRDEKRKTLSATDAETILVAEKHLKKLLKRIREKRQLKDLSDLLALPFIRPMLFVGNLKDYSRLRGKIKTMETADWDWIIQIMVNG